MIKKCIITYNKYKEKFWDVVRDYTSLVESPVALGSSPRSMTSLTIVGG